MQSIAANLINNMTFISIVIIISMIAIFAIAVINNLLLKQAYAKIVKELDAINNDGMEVYNNKMLNEIVTAYKEAYLKSYDGVNTQAIIESKFYKLDKNKINKESFLSNVNTLILTLGIVGTLYNIIVIVTKITQIFKGVDTQTIPSMTSVMGDVSTIIAYLAVAFVTTFIAIALCFIYSIINSITHVDMERINLFSRLENYLDNNLAVNLAKQKPKMLPNESYSNANVLYAIKNTSESMMKMTAQIEATIQRLNTSIKDTIEEKSVSSKPKLIANSEYCDEEEFDGYEQLRLERIKKIQETKKEIDAKALEKLDSLKNADVVPNKDKVYVKEVVDEELTKQKQEEQNQKEEKTKEDSQHKIYENLDKIYNTDDIYVKEEFDSLKNTNANSNENINVNTNINNADKVEIPSYQFNENKFSSNELNEELKKEERKLDTILSEEENVESVKTIQNDSNNYQATNFIKALTSEDIEMLKKELIKRQQEEKAIKEFLNKNV